MTMPRLLDDVPSAVRRTTVIECPSCSEPLLRIVYGYPSREAVEMATRGEIALGGCRIEGDEPTHRCRACGRSFRAKQDRAMIEVQRVPYDRASLSQGTWKARFGKGWDWAEVRDKP
jgi:hypothetical protein